MVCRDFSSRTQVWRRARQRCRVERGRAGVGRGDWSRGWQRCHIVRRNFSGRARDWGAAGSGAASGDDEAHVSASGPSNEMDSAGGNVSGRAAVVEAYAGCCDAMEKLGDAAWRMRKKFEYVPETTIAAQPRGRLWKSGLNKIEREAIGVFLD
ncbi:hypothetical protein PR003_g19183 [Phytophthora rubi]|uniref:Uncharacterized protein n=1 Tax=Phytophthora rubi TaxID=129364 RepID=A0A6A4DZG4_9STRA|nr:hypothetical protein PR001_g21520 [Phytophthora rubi]KAE9014962.1 hypothetical protein PR002_g14069 [Phytophthora rubi]KAE9314672.1 hypothetical protein PR003_g19183 [Phytophthora rubi]